MTCLYEIFLVNKFIPLRVYKKYRCITKMFSSCLDKGKQRACGELVLLPHVSRCILHSNQRSSYSSSKSPHSHFEDNTIMIG